LVVDELADEALEVPLEVFACDPDAVEEDETDFVSDAVVEAEGVETAAVAVTEAETDTGVVSGTAADTEADADEDPVEPPVK